MFPSNNGDNTIPDAYAADQCFFGGQTHSRNDLPSSFFHSFDHADRFLRYDHELLSAHFMQFPQHLATDAVMAPAAVEGVANIASSSKDKAAVASKKRSSKKERHSKIFTAQGLRDRRMRLSVDVAHRFFGLQDMLGFDKASKTVGWLLTKSKAAIMELSRGGDESNRGASSGSECEDVSVIDETSPVADLPEKSSVAIPKPIKILQSSQKSTSCPVARESRAIARAKARERTKEKMSRRLKESKQLPKDPNQFQPWSPLPSAGEESGSHCSDKKSSELGAEVSEPTNSGLSIFDYHPDMTNSEGMNTSNLVSFNNNDMMNFFPDNWEMENSRNIQQLIASSLTKMASGF